MTLYDFSILYGWTDIGRRHNELESGKGPVAQAIAYEENAPLPFFLARPSIHGSHIFRQIRYKGVNPARSALTAAFRTEWRAHVKNR